MVKINLKNFKFKNIFLCSQTFVITEKSHNHFKTNQADIIYTLQIPLKKALCGFKVKIPTLEKELLLLDFPNGVNPKDQKRIQNRGLPVGKDSQHRGDLIVCFKVKYPKLGKFQKDKLIEIFGHFETNQIQKDRILPMLKTDLIEVSKMSISFNRLKYISLYGKLMYSYGRTTKQALRSK